MPEDRTPRSISRRLFDLSWPIIGLNLLQVLALAVDTAMVGRTPGAGTALTGMGYASQLVFLLMVAMIGLTVGTVVFVARAHGSGEHDRVTHILDQSVQLTVVLGVVVAIVGNLIATPILLALGADAASMDAGLTYLRPLLLGTPFSYLMILFAAALRGVGNTRLAFFISLAMNGLNVLFNYGLILGNYGLPALGIQGAAIGTVLSQACAVLFMVVALRRGATPGLVPTLRLQRFDVPLIRDLFRIGWPAAADMLVLNASFLSIVGMLGRIDQSAVAAHGIGLRVQALAFVPGMSIGQAVGALVGMALGADDVAEARRVLWAGIVGCMAVMTPLGLFLIALADPIVTLFGVESGSSIHSFSVMWMQILGVSMPVTAIFLALGGLLQGSGDTRASLRINTALTFAVQIPLSWLLGFPLGLGAFGVWVSFPVTFAAKTAWAAVEVRRGRWAKTGARV